MKSISRYLVPGIVTLTLLLPFVLLLVITLPGVTPEPGEAIDGNWCLGEDGGTGARFTIDGAKIVTQGGAEIGGEYRRRAFSYFVPSSGDPTGDAAGDATAKPGAGDTVSIVQRDENTIQVRRGPDPAASLAAAPEIWRRCAAAESRPNK